jgi:hypothetical protein
MIANQWFTRVLRGLCIAASFAVLSPTHAGPLGDPFRVNNYTAGNQYVSRVVTGANGDTLTLWTDQGRGNANFIQRHDSAGAALQSDEWYVGYDVHAAALDRSGNYVLVRVGSDGSGNGLFATVYDRSGNVRVSEFRVNDTTVADQTSAQVAMNAVGDFAVAWTSYASGAPAVYVKRFRANGTAVAAETLASTGTNQQFAMGIAIDASGNFVPTWYSQVPFSNQLDIWVQRFNSAGAALTNPIRANTYASGTQAGNRIAMSPTGSFVVVWESYGQDGNQYGVYGQLYNYTATPIGTEFRVNSTTTGSQQLADVGMMDDGSFVVVWENDNRMNVPNSLPVVYARQYRNTGTPYAVESVVNSTANSKAFAPRIGMSLAGGYTVGWRHLLNGSSDIDVHARRYIMDTLPPITTVVNNQIVNNLAGAASSWTYFKISVPTGMRTLDITIAGPAGGDADLYARYAALPTTSAWDARPYLDGNNEQAIIDNIPSGDWYIGIRGYTSYSAVSLTVRYY